MIYLKLESNVGTPKSCRCSSASICSDICLKLGPGPCHSLALAKATHMAVTHWPYQPVTRSLSVSLALEFQPWPGTWLSVTVSRSRPGPGRPAGSAAVTVTVTGRLAAACTDVMGM